MPNRAKDGNRSRSDSQTRDCTKSRTLSGPTPFCSTTHAVAIERDNGVQQTLLRQAIATLNLLSAPVPARSFDEAIDRYARDYLTPALLARSTIDYRSRDCRRLRPLVGALSLAGTDWRAEAVKLHESGLYTPAICTQICNTMGRVLVLAREEWGWLDKPHRIPMALTQRQDAPCKAVLSPEQVLRLQTDGLDVLARRDLELDHRYRRLPGAIDAVRFLLVTGLRVSEACTLEWASVDSELRWIYLPDAKMRARYAVVGQVGAAILARAKGRKIRDGRWVFNGRRTHVNRRTLLATVRDAAALAGVDAWPHLLRHSWATTALRLRVPPRLVAEALGHKDEAMLRRYQHVAADDLRAEVDRVGAAHLVGGPHG